MTDILKVQKDELDISNLRVGQNINVSDPNDRSKTLSGKVRGIVDDIVEVRVEENSIRRNIYIKVDDTAEY